MLYLLVDLLPTRLQDRAKAIVAGGLSALVAAVVVGLLFDSWDKAAISAAIVGLLTGGATFAQPNGPSSGPVALQGAPADGEDTTTTGRPVAELGRRGPDFER